MVEKKPISELPSSTVHLITATQIATSVSNIVKELVENSMDAGSTIIRVKLENSGLTKIEVIDNGSGVSKEDALKMALPHFTSKISQHHDLESLTTYGFRGEALAAMCAVAKVSITTKTANDPVASTYTMDSNGNVVDTKPSPMSQGTLVVASSLFWNVPVRKQVYQTPKKKKEELTKVEDLLLNFGLIHPELHLSLHHDHTLVWQKSRAPDFKSNILQTLGHDVCSNMEFISKEEPTTMFLMIPKRGASVELCFRHKPDRCFTFINQRPVISKEFEKLMKELYSYALEGQKTPMYPIYLASLQLPANELDVNLEPNKTKVLMKRQAEILEEIRAAVSGIIGKADESPPQKSIVDEPMRTTVREIASKTNEAPPQKLVVDESIRTTVNGIASKTNEPPPQKTVVDESTLDPDSSIMDQSTSEMLQFELGEDDDLFRGFEEPFNLPDESTTADPQPKQPKSITIGSAEWSRGLATNAEGRIVHPVEVLRGQPHFAKRLSDPPPLSGSPAKKPRLAEIFESTRIIGPNPPRLETVNGKVRKMPPDSFGEYCKEVRNEILSQDPTMSFNELSQKLSQGWQNLSKPCREKYENKAESGKQRYNASKMRPPPSRSSALSNTSLDRYLLTSSPDNRRQRVVPASADPPSPLPPKPSIVHIDFSMKMMAEALDSMTSLPADDLSWSCLKQLNERCWLCSNGKEIMAINFDRLNEVIIFDRLASEHILPSRILPNPIEMNASALGDPFVWNVLVNLPRERETANSEIVTDPRLVSNGLSVRICKRTETKGTVAQVFKVPSGVESFDLEDVVKLLQGIAEKGSTVKSCRTCMPDKLIKTLKFEAARMAKDRCDDPDEEEVSELLEQWLSTYPDNRCLHGEPVVWNYAIGVDGESEEEEEED